jgi:membrane protein DedA with SNARE-associated domain
MMVVLDKWMEWQKLLAHNAWLGIENHGYIAMFLLLFASGIGLPLPEDIPLIAAGVQIARRNMTRAVAGPLAWVAMMFGDSALYILGYALGWRVVHLPVIGRHVSATRLKRCEDWFSRWGIWAIGIGRMFAGIRTAMVVAAGTMRFTYLKMLAADGVAALISGGAFMILGYWAGRHAGKPRDLVDKYRELFTPFALVTAIVLIIWLYWRSRRRAYLAGVKRRAEIAETIKPA